MKRLCDDRRGTAAILVAGALPMLLGLAALAVDLGAVQLERRRLQGVADAGALAAARDLRDASGIATRLIAASPGRFRVAGETVTGRYRTDAGMAAAGRFEPATNGADAVRITVRSDVPTLFAAVFGTPAVTVERRATARRIDMAGIAIGSRLASLDGGIANAVLGGLTGSNLSLSVMDYRALASAKVDLLPWLKSLGGDAKLSAATYDDVLAAELPAGTVLGSLSRQVADPAARAALSALTNAAQGTIRLADLIDLGDLGRQASGGEGLVRVDTLDLASNVLQGGATRRQVAVDLGAQIPGLARTRLWIAIGERPNRSPWIAIARDNEVVVRTAQMRLYLETRLDAKPLPGLSLASIELPLYVEMASGEARLEALNCAAPRSVDIAGKPNPGQVAVGRVDPAMLDNFQSPVARYDARFLETLLLRVEGRAAIDMGAAEPFQIKRFDSEAIVTGTPQTVRGSALTGGFAASLTDRISLRATLLGFLPVPVDPIVKGVGAQLSAIAPAIDPVLTSATRALGVGIGEADLWVTGVRCGQAVLVE